MLWLLGLGSSGIAGLLIGLRFRAPAALAASVVAAAVAVAIGAFNRASAVETLILAVLSVGCLQIAYLGGLSISSRRSGRRSGRRVAKSRDEDIAI